AAVPKHCLSIGICPCCSNTAVTCQLQPCHRRWRIVEMYNRGSDFLDLVVDEHLTFDGTTDREIAFGALKGFLDVRYGTREGSACAEFSWKGYDENDSASGRGWAAIGTAGCLVGHFYIHNGDESGFFCERDG